MQQGQQPTQTEMVSGLAVPQSPVAGLARALQQGIGGYMGGQADREEASKAQAAQQTMAQALGAYSRSQAGGETPLQNGETITWNKADPSQAARMYQNILMGNPDTAPMGMQAAMGQMQAQQNAAQELEQFKAMMPLQVDLARQRAQAEAQYRAPTAQPAPLQVANAYLEAVQSGDMDRANAIREFAKTQEKGTYTDSSGTLAPLPGAVNSKLQFEAGGKPMPATIVQAQDELLDKINISQGIAAKMDKFTAQIDGGTLDLNLMANLQNKARNNLSMSTEESRNLASFEASLEELRNDSLQLNTGVQTDGDAQRAWSELVANINDPAVVRQRLQEIKAINERGTVLQEQRLNVMRSEYGRGALPSPSGAQGTGNPAITQPDYSKIDPLLKNSPAGGAAFNTLEEAEAANLPPGTVITIGGRKAVIE